jgi:hypothetical protein
MRAPQGEPQDENRVCCIDRTAASRLPQQMRTQRALRTGIALENERSAPGSVVRTWRPNDVSIDDATLHRMHSILNRSTCSASGSLLRT